MVEEQGEKGSVRHPSSSPSGTRRSTASRPPGATGRSAWATATRWSSPSARASSCSPRRGPIAGSRPPSSWRVGIFALLGPAIFLIHWQRALLNLRALDPPQSTWTLTEEGVAQKSSLGQSAIAWGALLEVWRFPDLWLLIWGKDVYSTIPVAQMPRETRELIERRVRATGGAVR